MIRPDTSLWAFSVSFYQHPNVEALCLRLQDQHAINVNWMLWALWLDKICQISDFAVWELGVSKARRWHCAIVVPLRRLRRCLPKLGFWGACRTRLLEWELLAEKRELAILERASLSSMPINCCREREASSLFLNHLLGDLEGEQARVLELFEQWSQAGQSVFSAGEKKPLD